MRGNGISGHALLSDVRRYAATYKERECNCKTGHELHYSSYACYRNRSHWYVTEYKRV
jgi:hypothetical protein